MKLFQVIMLCMITHALNAQQCDFTLSGTVQSGSRQLAGATVFIKETQATLAADGQGYFSIIKLCAGHYTLQVSYINYDTVTQKIDLAGNQHIEVNLQPAKTVTLKNVTVITQSGPASSGFLEQLKGRKLDENKGVSISEALSKINGVTLLQTGSTVSKPVLHGLHSNRILTINNGVRQEGQQWGNEHAPEIDAYIADNLQVIKGVDELRYGSDAIGGVILINPRSLRYKPGYFIELNTGYFTNNREYVAAAMYEQTFKKLPAFSYRLQATYKQGENINTPHYRLNNTGLKEQNFSVTAGWKKEKYTIEAFYSQFDTKLGIFPGSHVETISDLQVRIDSIKPNKVFLGEHTYAIKRPYQEVLHQLFKLKSAFQSGNSRFNLQFASQFNHRQEFDIVRNQALGAQLNLRIATLSEDASWEHPATGNFKGTVGIAAMQQDNWYSGRYFIPNYTATTFGSYWLEKWTKGKWELQGGLRYDYKYIDTRRIKSDSTQIVHHFNFKTLAASVNTTYNINQHNKVNLLVSLSSRAPYVNELLSDGIHQADGVYYLGDINLKTEHAVNFIASYGYSNVAHTVTADISAYCNSIGNFIYLQPKPETPVQTIAGAYPLFRFQQADALLTGLDAAVRVSLAKRLEITSKLALLRARNRTLNDWLILMPSDRLTNELAYNFPDKGKLRETYISAEVPTVFKQARVPGDKTGKQDYAPAPDGYTVLNINMATTITAGNIPVTVGIGARNLLNKQYREYLNTFRYFTDETGRNINIRCRIPFEKLF